jgi:hypothetical protein
MRDKQTEKHVRIASTGHAEGDMLGQVLLWVDKRQNSKFAQRPHKTTKRKTKIRVVSKWFQTAPTACCTACWRSLNVLKGKGKVIYTRVVNRVRKLLVNS